MVSTTESFSGLGEKWSGNRDPGQVGVLSGFLKTGIPDLTENSNELFGLMASRVTVPNVLEFKVGDPSP